MGTRSKFKTVWIIGIPLPGQQGQAEPQYGYYAGLRRFDPKNKHEEPRPSLSLDPNSCMQFDSRQQAERFRLTLDGPSRFTVMEHTVIERNNQSN